MNIKAWNALLVIALLIVLAGGGYILYQNNLQKQAEIAVAELAAEEEAERKALEVAALKQSFDDFLNEFLQNIQKEITEYKKNRAVLSELIKPANLREPEYIEENARMAESTVMALQLQMDDVMGTFEEADRGVQSLLQQFEGDDFELVEKSWVGVLEENSSKFTAYFTTEQDILMAQLRLVEFYNENREGLSMDVVNDRAIFDSVEKQEQEALIRGEIIELRAVQKDVLKKEANAAEE